MEQQPSTGSRRHDKEPEFNLKEWGLKARIISRENTTSSRRYSASYIRSFREDARSFRSNITISSTASSPGYAIREEIDPSTYSFTNALRALQAKTVYTWEYMSPDGLALNSKWSEAERYICNPLSGEVPIECLSAKTLSGRSLRQLRNRFTMSAPLIYPAQPRQLQMKPPMITTLEDDDLKTTIKEKRNGSKTRDVGTQSTLAAIRSNSPSPATTPSIEERSIKSTEAKNEDSPISTEQVKLEEEVKMNGLSEEEDTKRNVEGEKNKAKHMQGGCLLSWRSLWMKRRQREKHKSRNNNKNIFLCHINGC